MVGIGTGIFIGLSANYILNHFSKSSYFNKMLNLDKLKYKLTTYAASDISLFKKNY